MTSPNRATVWLRSPSGRCDPVEVDIDPPDTLAALAKWERVTGRTDRCVVTVRPAPPGAGPPNPVLGLPAIVGEPADSLLGHLADEHGIGGDTGRWLLQAQGVVGLVKEHDLDHAENPEEELGHAHPIPIVRIGARPHGLPPTHSSKEPPMLWSDKLTVEALIEALEDCDSHAEVRLAHQPSWPLQLRSTPTIPPPPWTWRTGR